MESLLRLLSPKTTNFDSTGGGSFGALTREDVLIAISYAKLSPVQDLLLRLRIKTPVNDTDLNEAADLMVQAFQNSQTKYERSVWFMALLETFAVAGDYKPTVRGRAVIMKIHYLRVHRHYDHQINHAKLIIQAELHGTGNKIKNQMKQLKGA